MHARCSALLSTLLLLQQLRAGHALQPAPALHVERSYRRFVEQSNASYPELDAAANKLGLHWMAPFFSGGGYCSEAISFIGGLSAGRSGQLVTIEQHGDVISSDFVGGLSREQRNRLYALATKEPVGDFVCVCHSEPGAWHISPQLPQRYSTSPCPRSGALATVGRTMFESDRLPAGWVDRLLGVDEVWVPTAFAAEVFRAGGVPTSRILVVPEAVDTVWFDPAGTPSPSDTAASRRVQRGGIKPPLHPVAEIPARACGEDPRSPGGSSPACPYRFLSVGKWERRKGFDVLLRALFTAFVFEDGAEGPFVEGYILTSSYHSSSSFTEAIAQMVRSELTCPGEPTVEEEAHVEAVADMLARGKGLGCIPGRVAAAVIASLSDSPPAGRTDAPSGFRLPSLRLLHGLPETDMPSTYASMDALVQPSRGEGWGRPHAEGMAMALPVIATLWSGPSEFMTEQNSFPLRHTGLLPIPEGPFRGHLQAEPDVAHLQALMQLVIENQVEAARRGRAARRDMELYSPASLARFVRYHALRLAGEKWALLRQVNSQAARLGADGRLLDDSEAE